MSEILQNKVKIQPDVLFQVVNGEAVLLNLKNESYFGLDKTGTRIWELLNESDELQTVFNTMLDEFDVDADRLETDIDNLVRELIDAGLVELA